MAERNFGEAVIVYEHPEDGTVERTVDNESIAYFQDHWILKFDEDEAGNDVVRRIPLQRVHYVERSVERFEDEIKSFRKQVESFAKDLRATVLGGGDGGESDERREIEIETGSETGTGSETKTETETERD